MKLLDTHELFDAIFEASQAFSILDKLIIAKNALEAIAHLHHDARHMVKHEEEERQLAIAKKILGDPQKVKEHADAHETIQAILAARSQKQGILHRNIKLENLYVNAATLAVKRCDYGLAAKLPSRVTKPSLNLTLEEAKTLLIQGKEYLLDTILSEDNFGCVYLARDQETGAWLAISRPLEKISNKFMDTEAIIQELMDENQILSQKPKKNRDDRKQIRENEKIIQKISINQRLIANKITDIQAKEVRQLDEKAREIKKTMKRY
ncbi:Protein kinase domain [Legionella beliardensis]|uniref:Protein kinase domain n=1 Tax=Legionella beliardensis TaxID=91822 RepID=A0A378I268_9GAMM|nr:hypothetical protein [Legionella beliardensis]STX29287.1 Protein kinase domain [Legionella beliardensis]